MIYSKVVMYSHVDVEQHINGCDVLRALISQKKEIVAKIDRKRYEKYFQRELSELNDLQMALESLMYIVDYPLVERLIQALKAAKKDPNVAGVTVRYPFKPFLQSDDHFSLIDLCSYGV